jgi:hypothetical protein
VVIVIDQGSAPSGMRPPSVTSDYYDNFQILLDEPTERPGLGYDRYANQLAQLIAKSRAKFSVSILASWGSGKTTLLNAIRDQMRRDLPNEVICVDFNAWRYEREPDLIIPLLDSIREAMQRWISAQPNTATDRARAVVGTIGRVARAFAAGLKVKTPIGDYDVDAAFEELEAGHDTTAASVYFAAFNELEQVMQEFVGEPASGDTRRIVVFVDDLDRCLPDRALELLEHMKLFFDIEGFVFVAGIDQAVIARAVEHRYRSALGESVEPGQPHRANGDRAHGSTDPAGARSFGRDYLKKIFQVSFPLPPIDETYLVHLLDELAAQTGIHPQQAAEINGRVADHLAHFVSGVVNPREIKLFINLYTVTAKLLCDRLGAVEPDVVLAVQVLSSRQEWEPIYNELLEDPESFIADLDDLASRGFPGTFERYVSAGPGGCLAGTTEISQYVKVVEATRTADPTCPRRGSSPAGCCGPRRCGRPSRPSRSSDGKTTRRPT